MYQSQRPQYGAPMRPQQPSQRPQPFRHSRRKGVVIVILALLVAGGLFFFFWTTNRDKTDGTGAKKPGGTSQTGANSFDKQQHSTSSASSIWVVVNKPLSLDPQDYAPSDLVTPSVPLRVPGNESMQLRAEAASALEQLIAAAKAQGLDMMLASGYRSYAYQVNLYGGYVSSIGREAADRTSARPGHSEHQTGLAADLEPSTRDCELETCFGDLPEGKWLAENAYKFGFVIRYPADKVAITGYEYEPWHIRYVGTALSVELHKSGQSMEEFFGLRGGKSFE
jgi:D-alanyl-D-alanine carboxypeptidase